MRRLYVDNSNNIWTKRKRACWFVVIFAVTLLCVPVVLYAATTCAVITSANLELDTSPLPDLVEFHLIKNPELSILNRSDIKNILAEKALAQTLPTNRESIQQWGAFLRADVLAILEDHKAEKGVVVEVTIVETKHGLRLASDQIVLDKEVERAAELISKRISQSVLRFKESFNFVFAVPLFKSGDFTFDFDHLKRSYARLAEQAILQQPGTIVVDLENAAEIAKELSITEGDAKVTRALPYYIIGEYHNCGQEGKRQVDIKLTLRYGDEIVATEEAPNLKPSEVNTFLQNTVTKMLEKHLGTTTNKQIDGQSLEADFLEERGRSALLFGEWKEAIQLFEACLLLDPSRKHLHFQIFTASKGLVQLGMDLIGPGYGPIIPSMDHEDLPSAKGRRRYILSGLEHLEHHLRYYGYGEREKQEMSEYWSLTPMLIYSVLEGQDFPQDFVAAEEKARLGVLMDLKEIQREICLAKVEIVLYILQDERFKVNEQKSEPGKALDELAGFAATCISRQPATWLDRTSGSLSSGEEKLFTLEEYFNETKRLIIALGQFKEGFNAQCRLIYVLFDYAKSHPQAFQKLMTDLDDIEEGPTHLLPEFVQIVRSREGEREKPHPNKYSQGYYRMLWEVSQVMEAELDALVVQAYPHRKVKARDLYGYGIKGVVFDTTGLSVSANQNLEEEKRERLEIVTKSPPRGKLVITPIELKTSDGKPVHYKYPYDKQLFFDLEEGSGWISAGNYDVIYNRPAVYVTNKLGFAENYYISTVYVMKEPGILEPIFVSEGKKENYYYDVQWDGKYLWVAQKGDDEHIRVFEAPTFKMIAVFGKADGLPPTSYGCKIAPLSAGKVCVVGYFGRTWIANLSLSSGESNVITKTVDVFHEATESFKPRLAKDVIRSNVSIAFEPVFAMTVPTKDSAHPKVLIGRTHKEYPTQFPSMEFTEFDALIVDPIKQSVLPFPGIWPRRGQPVVINDQVYIMDDQVKVCNSQDFLPRDLIRIRPEGLLPLAQLDCAIYHEGVLHCAGWEGWYTVEPNTPMLLRSRADIQMPFIRHDGVKALFTYSSPRLVVSKHFGLVIYGTQGVGQVSFLDE